MTLSSAFSASLSVPERAAYGRDARRRASRSCHGWFEADADAGRTDPIEVIERQSATRLQELVPIRYGRMLESPFRFYRGAAAIMASDLGPLPNTGLTVQLCGDAHLLNFRLLASPERHLVFDINDFDETLAGPFEWDVKRLAASFAIAGRANGFPVEEQNGAVRACVKAYRRRMREFAGMRTLDIWYAQDDADRLRELHGLVDGQGEQTPYRRGDGEGPDAHPSPGLREAHPGHGRGPADRPGPAADHPARGTCWPDSSGEGRRRSSATSWPSTHGPCRPSAGICCAATTSLDMARKVVGRRQRRHALLDRAPARPRRRRPAAAPGQGGGAVGPRRRTLGGDALRQPGPRGWWRGSG